MSYENVYSKMCRTCLTENSVMKSVFVMEEFMEQSVMLSDILMSCASVQILKGDGLPDQVCLSCVQEMNRAYLFRKLCEKSDATLRHYMNSVLPLPMKVEAKYNIFEDDIFSHKQDELTDDAKCNFNLAKPEISENIDTEVINSDSLYDHIESDCNISDDLKSVKENSEHADNEVKKKNYNCKQCGEACFGLGSYRRHMAQVHNQIFKCEFCRKEFKSKTVLIRHKAIHKSQETSDRKQEVLSKPNMYKGKTGITKKRNLPRTCTICNKTFRFHSNLERHKLIHTGEKPYLCNVCGKGFAQLSYLKIHSFIHTGEKPYKCQMCEKSFAAPGTLMTHIRTHTGERPHVCKICGKDFPQSGYLSAHIRTHTGEKPVECKVCHRRFNQSGRLIIHMRIHSGEKPYSCKDCGRCFAVKGTLKKHIRTHTGERPYICSVCGQAFAQSGTLATHMKVHRPK